MHTATRLLIFAAVVIAIALTIAPPISGQTIAPTLRLARTVGLTQLPSPPAARDSVDPSGTYVGTVTPDGGAADGGMIVIRRDNGALVVTAGPSADQQFPADKVDHAGDVLRFQLVPPGDEPRLIEFDVKIEGWKMTGVATMTREGEKSTARLAFTKQ